MKRDRLTPGIILVFIGIVILLSNLGYLHFHWMNIIHLWPVFLVIGGINLIFANNHTIGARVVKIAVVLLALSLLFFGDFGNRFSFIPGIYLRHNNNSDNFNFESDDDDDDDSDTVKNGNIVKVDGNSFYHAPFATGIKTARLNLSGGGTNYTLGDTTGELFTANVKEYYGHYNMENHIDDSVSVVDFNMKGHHNDHFRWNNDNKSNKATLKLNADPIWEVNVNAGATDLDFDLSKFKVREFTINGGAASFKVKLGAPTVSNTDVTIKSGVSDITIDVPKDAECSIVSSTGLSSNSFNGFNKTSDNHYQTPGFASAKKHINISISGGLSDFKVNRY